MDFFYDYLKIYFKYLPFQLKEILLELFSQVQEATPQVVQLSTELVSHLASSADLPTIFPLCPRNHPYRVTKQQPENLHEMR